MKIINNIKKYKFTYIALIASFCLTAGPISEMLKTEQKSDIKTKIKNNTIIKSICNWASKINTYTKNKLNKTKEKSKYDIIIDETTKLVKSELKQSTKDIVTILDYTVADGRLKLGKGLKLRSECRKKTTETTNKLVEIIDATVAKLETNDEIKNSSIKSYTDAFVSETKKEVSEVQKSMSTEMRKALGKKSAVVFDCTNKAKIQIAEFEDKVIAKIEEFSDKLKQNIKQEAV